MKNPLVSIIIPIYNAEKYLEENIRSVLCQHYENIEVIYVCDGCTDGSIDILNRFVLDQRLRIINRQHNIGAAASRNQGIKESHGEWLIFWDADDVVLPNAIEVLVEAANMYLADMVVCSYGKIGEEKYGERDEWLFNYIKEIVPDYPLYFNDKKIVDLSSMLVCNAPFNKLINRRLIDTGDVWFQELTNCNDVYFSASAFLNSNRIAYVDKKLYWYREDSNGSISSKRTEYKSYILDALNLVRKKMQKLHYPENVFRNYAFCEIEGYKDLKVYSQIIEEYHNKYEDVWEGVLNNGNLYCIKKSDFLLNKRVFIFGAGRVGKDYYQELKDVVEFLGWIDTQKSSCNAVEINRIKEISFDYVIIATKSFYNANQMKDTLLSAGVNLEKIIMRYPRYSLISIE